MGDPQNMNIAFFVQSVRKQRAMSGERLAKLCHTTRQQINRIERGIDWNMKVGMIANMAEGLKVDPAIVLACCLESKRQAEEPEALKGPQS